MGQIILSVLPEPITLTVRQQRNPERDSILTFPSGAHAVETIIVYSKPPNGPYDEVHVLAPLTIPALNLSFYGDYDGKNDPGQSAFAASDLHDFQERLWFLTATI
jgi:hypothetical protein